AADGGLTGGDVSHLGDRYHWDAFLFARPPQPRAVSFPSLEQKVFRALSGGSVEEVEAKAQEDEAAEAARPLRKLPF
ncbi:unnamed protein product, partial [Durusdinium trenchii]